MTRCRQSRVDCSKTIPALLIPCEDRIRYRVEITDSDGNSFRVQLSLPLDIAGTDPANSTWSVADEGFLKYRSGGCSGVGAFAEPLDLGLLRGRKEYGVVLYQFTDWVRFVNDSGDGRVAGSWAGSLTPGDITWVLLD